MKYIYLYLLFRDFLIPVPDTSYRVEYKGGRKFIDIRDWYVKNGEERRTYRGIHLLKESLKKLIGMKATICADFDQKKMEVNA